MPDALEFEQPLLDLENRIAALQAQDDPLRVRDEITRLFVELMKAMAAGKQAHECYAQHLFEYLYGRERLREDDLEASLKPLALADANVIKEVGRRSRLKVPIKSMIVDLVSTDAFLTRLP